MRCDEIRGRLDDLLDGVLPEAERRALDAHLDACPGCRAELASLRRVLRAAAALPREEDLPRDLWPAIRPGLAPRRSGPGRMAWRGALVAAALLAGAVILLPALRRTAPGEAAGRSGEMPALAALRTAESECGQAEAELRALMARRPAELPAVAAEVVERNLAILDEAIASTRRAFEKDPSNDEVGRLLVAAHRKKIELLRDAVRLSLST